MTFPTLTVEIGFVNGASTSTYLQLDDAARGKLGTGTLGPDVVWTDVTAYLRSVTCRRGVSRVDGPVLRYEAGGCTIELDDSDRRFDPDSLSGPYVSAGVTQVTPMRAVRVRATWSGVTYDVWRGFADSWQTTYYDPNLSVCTLQATDGAKVLSAYVRAAVASVGGSEDTGARVGRILDSAAWSSVDRVVATGDSTLQATTLNGSAWDEALLANDSEIGELYFDAAGRVVFRNRLALMQDSRSNTSQATFGDSGAELKYVGITPDYDDTALYNLARITRSGGAEQTSEDSSSIASYLTHVFERSDLLLETDGAAADWGSWVVSQAKDPERRFAQLVVDAHGDATNLFPQVLTREIGDRITVKRRPPGGGSVISRDVIIRGIAHDIDRSLTWRTTWQLQSASRLQFLTLDHASLGQLDANSLAF